MSNGTPDCLYFVAFDIDGGLLGVNRIRRPWGIRALASAALARTSGITPDYTSTPAYRKMVRRLGVRTDYLAGEIEHGESTREVRWGIAVGQSGGAATDTMVAEREAAEVALAQDAMGIDPVLAVAMARVAMQWETVRALLVADGAAERTIAMRPMLTDASTYTS